MPLYSQFFKLPHWPPPGLNETFTIPGTALNFRQAGLNQFEIVKRKTLFRTFHISHFCSPSPPLKLILVWSLFPAPTMHNHAVLPHHRFHCDSWQHHSRISCRIQMSRTFVFATSSAYILKGEHEHLLVWSTQHPLTIHGLGDWNSDFSWNTLTGASCRWFAHTIMPFDPTAGSFCPFVFRADNVHLSTFIPALSAYPGFRHRFWAVVSTSTWTMLFMTIPNEVVSCCRLLIIGSRFTLNQHLMIQFPTFIRHLLLLNRDDCLISLYTLSAFRQTTPLRSFWERHRHSHADRYRWIELKHMLRSASLSLLHRVLESRFKNLSTLRFFRSRIASPTAFIFKFLPLHHLPALVQTHSNVYYQSAAVCCSCLSPKNGLISYL